MAAQLEIRVNQELPTSILWHNVTRSMSCKETELACIVDEIAKKIVTDKKSGDAPKKLCLCAPTTHAGSFKCRLHRASATHKALASSVKNIHGKKSFITKKRTEGGRSLVFQTFLSRFSREVTAATHALSTTLQKHDSLYSSQHSSAESSSQC